MDKCPVDCGDSGCICASERSGMRTNGGCRCFKGLPTEHQRRARSAVMYWRRRAEAVETPRVRFTDDEIWDIVSDGDVLTEEGLYLFTRKDKDRAKRLINEWDKDGKIHIDEKCSFDPDCSIYWNWIINHDHDMKS